MKEKLKPIKLKGLKVFTNKRNQQHMLVLPKKKLRKGKIPKYIDIKVRY